MSGPKVVRIVTREELIAICEGQLARVEAAIVEWARITRRNDAVTESEIAGAGERLTRLRRLLQMERFADLQKQAAREVAFLHDNQEARLAQAAAKAAAARSADRRRSDAARSLLAALRRRSTVLEPAFEAALERAAAGQAEPAAFARGFALLTASNDTGAEARRALAQSLKDGDEDRDLATWIRAQPGAADEPAMERLDKRLAEFALVAEPAAAEVFEARLAKIRGDPRDARRGLLLDSLEIDLGAALAEARKRAATARALRLAVAEFAQIDAAAGASVQARAGRVQGGADLEGLLDQVKAAIVERRSASAATARRAAVLKSLTGLGYEVREGMSTGWADQGRVILRKPALPDYGVEISGDPRSARLQMRVVAFTDEGSVSDPARDKDAETLWCGEVEVLRKELADAGGDLVIERALPAGAAPLKSILNAERQRHVAREGLASRSRMAE